MRLRTKLLSFAAVPLAGISVVAWIGLSNTIARMDSANTVTATIEAAIPLGDLVHELQVERGMSAGFIASGGANFADALPGQRQRVDAGLAVVTSLVGGLEAGSAGELRAAIETIGEALSLRADVSDTAITVPEMAGAYTAAVRSLLKTQRSRLADFEVAGISRAGAGWIALSEAKEAAGLERAMGATGLGAERFPPPVLRRFWELGALQTGQIADAELLLRELLGTSDFLASAEYSTVAEARTAISHAATENVPAGITAPEWFTISTAWIERLRDYEIAVATAAGESAVAEASQAQRDVIVYSTVIGVAFLATAIGVLAITRTIVRGSASLISVMAKVAHKDFDVAVPFTGDNSEFGDLGRSLESMRTSLQAADEKLRAAFAKSFAFGDSDAAMLIVDTDLRIIGCNTAADELLRRGAQCFGTVLHSFDAGAPAGQSIEGLAGPAVDLRALFRDPAALPWRSDIDIGNMMLEVNVSYVEAENGAYAGNIVQMRDVTQERLFSGMIESIERDQCVAELTLEGTITRVNDLLASLIGLDSTALAGRSLESLLHPEDPLAGGLRDFWNGIVGGKSEMPRLKLQSVSGETIWMRAAFNPVMDGNGVTFKVVLIGEDITFGIERYQKELKAKEEAEAQQRHIVSSLAEGLSHISKGDLTYQIESPFEGTFDELRQNFNGTVLSLVEVMAGVLQSVEDLRTSSIALSSASADLARRTESQAATLQETAAALDEVTATVRSTAGEANSADEVVGQARDGAEDGGQTVARAIDAMELIASSSSEISSIIDVIDDISFQTNLLALNAGVEAARAGDAGRGFAVVASEVRALAQRATQSAQKINELVTKSQKHVEEGVSLVDSAGEVLGGIAETVVTASDRVSAIKLAAEEQSAAISEINAAVNQMDQATQQNAAMVEEATALSETLRRHSDELSSAVSAFRTGAATGARDQVRDNRWIA